MFITLKLANNCYTSSAIQIFQSLCQYVSRRFFKLSVNIHREYFLIFYRLDYRIKKERMVFVQCQCCMTLGGGRGFISNDSLNSWLSCVFVFCLFLMTHIPIEIILTKARQEQKIKKTITPNEFSVSILFEVALIAIVELSVCLMTIKLELVS